jgi:hypothetical protein
MSIDISKDGAKAVHTIGAANGAIIDKVFKRVTIKAETLHKMKKLANLFDDELTIDANESEVIGFFLEKGFDALVASGEINRRVDAVLGK